MQSWSRTLSHRCTTMPEQLINDAKNRLSQERCTGRQVPCPLFGGACMSDTASLQAALLTMTVISETDPGYPQL